MVLSFTAFAIAMVFGMFLAACRVSPVPPLRLAATAYVEVLRNIPLTVHFFLFAFGFTKFGVSYPFFTSAVIVMSAYTSSFVSESVRSGINAVSKGQVEAARSLGLGFVRTLTTIVLPQALRTVAGPLGSNFIAHHKNTSIASVIGVAELVGISEGLIVETAQPMWILLGVGLGYFIVTYPAGLLVGVLERKVAIKR